METKRTKIRKGWTMEALSAVVSSNIDISKLQHMIIDRDTIIQELLTATRESKIARETFGNESSKSEVCFQEEKYFTRAEHSNEVAAKEQEIGHG